MDFSNKTNSELESLVSQGDIDAICELANRYMYGVNGSEKNPTRAYQLLHKGEKRGDKRAYLGLAKMYENGLYFAKNQNLANQYYEKAGVQTTVNKQVEVQQTKVQKVAPSGGNDIRSKIEKAEKAREQSNYHLAKQECKEVLNMLDEISAGTRIYSGQEDIDRLRIDTYWVLAYTAFNQQKINKMDTYLSQEGVKALHPWGVYLSALTHRCSSDSKKVLEQDLQLLIQVSENQNLSMMEKSDVEMMIADLIMDGYGKSSGCTTQTAYDYYAKSAAHGNAYAQEQLANF